MDVFEVLSSLFMLLGSVFGVGCATMFIVVVALHRPCRTISILLVLNLAVAGWIVSVTYACQAVYQLVGDGNDALCIFRGFILAGSSGLLYHTLCVQALHRLFVTVLATRPYLQSARVIVSLVTLQWLFSATFGLPILLTGRFIYQTNSRVCPVPMGDLFSFLYYGMFIYICPMSIIVPIYVRIVSHAKRSSILITVCYGMVARQKRELHLIRRILTLVTIFSIIGSPYIVFFLIAQFTHSPPPSYSYRVSFMFSTCGQGISMLFCLITTEKVRKYLITHIGGRRRAARGQVQCVTTI